MRLVLVGIVIAGLAVTAMEARTAMACDEHPQICYAREQGYYVEPPPGAGDVISYLWEHGFGVLSVENSQEESARLYQAPGSAMVYLHSHQQGVYAYLAFRVATDSELWLFWTETGGVIAAGTRQLDDPLWCMPPWELVGLQASADSARSCT